jgi:hypothetical protein
MSTTESAAGPPGAKATRLQRRARTKPYLPKWLKSPAGAQAMAHGRCLMLLAVLSGQKTVTEAIEEARISRALYYQLEVKALRGMIRALDPVPETSASEGQELRVARRRIKMMSLQIKLLTQRKRSAERLLRLVWKSRTPLTSGRRGRPPASLSRGTMPGADSP